MDSSSFLGETERRNIRGWRLFTGDEIEEIKKSIFYIVETKRERDKS